MDLEFDLSVSSEPTVCKSGMQEVEDYYDNELEPEVKLKSGINLKDLRINGEFEFEVERPDEESAEVEPVSKLDSYKLHSNLTLGDGESEERPFLVLSRRKEMVNLTEDGLVKKEVLHQGVGPKVPRGNTVTIHYNAYIEHREDPYDSTRLRMKPFHFTLVKDFDHADNGFPVIPGLDLAVSTMCKNELSRFVIFPEYAYGPKGVPPRIPENSILMIEVELLNFRDLDGLEEYYSIPSSERRDAPFDLVKKAYAQQREYGRVKFGKEDFEGARKHYMHCKRLMEDCRLADEPQEAEQQKMLLNSLKNAIICCLKLNQFPRVLSLCAEAMRIDPNCAKLLYAQGKAYHHQGEYERSLRSLTRAKNLTPSTDIDREIQLLEKTMERHKNIEKQTYRRMFQTDTASKDEEPKPSAVAEKTSKDGEFILGKAENTLIKCTPTEYKELMEDFLEELLASEDNETILSLPTSTIPEGAQLYLMQMADAKGLAVDRCEKDGEFYIRLQKKVAK